MWKTFAVFSDIHANILALDACHEKIKIWENIWQEPIPIYINGDSLDAGPCPLQTIDAIGKMSNVFILGNHEDYLKEYILNKSHKKFSDPLWRFIPWTVEKIGEARLLRFVEKCQFRHSTDDGFLTLLHASPETHSKVVQELEAPEKRISHLPFQKSSKISRLFIVGHSHFSGIHENLNLKHTWINAGSVGYSFQNKGPSSNPWASFVVGRYKQETNDIFELEVHIDTVDYDMQKLVDSYIDSGALTDCTPYSVAILSQCIFNQDIVFKMFKEARKFGITQPQLPQFMIQHLKNIGVLDQLKSVLCSYGHKISFENSIVEFNQ